jgi:hypothetical protein
MILPPPPDDEALPAALERLRDMADPMAVGEAITEEDQAAFLLILKGYFGEEKQ